MRGVCCHHYQGSKHKRGYAALCRHVADNVGIVVDGEDAVHLHQQQLCLDEVGVGVRWVAQRSLD